jgi:hypothetical protein
MSYAPPPKKIEEKKPESKAPAPATIWELATKDRKIIIVREEGHKEYSSASAASKAEQELIDASKDKKGKPTYVTTATFAPESALTAQEIQSREYLKQSIREQYAALDEDEKSVGSSFPHLTPAANDTGRGITHVSSSRKVAVAKKGEVDYEIHERFRQDEASIEKAEPAMHDRFFATDPAGNVFAAKGTFLDDATGENRLNQKTLTELLLYLNGGARGKPLLSSQLVPFVRWEVKGENNTGVPLSPNSRTRTLPDHGYGNPPKGHAGQKPKK